MNRLAISIACFSLALPAYADFTLTLKVEGTTAGVIVGPQGSCPPACTQSVGNNQPVTLTVRSVSSTFLRWEQGSGPAKACNEAKSDCSFKMDGPGSITARFGPGLPLTLSRIGDIGSARNSQPFLDPVFPTEIQCPPDCVGTFAAGSEVVLRSEPSLIAGQAELTFPGWSGGTGSASSCVGASQTCRFTITQPSSLSFRFEKRATARIDVGFLGSGSVGVGFNPPMFATALGTVRTSCTHVGALNVPVSVDIIPSSNTAFRRWIGGPCDGSTMKNCTFTLLGPVSMKVEAARTDLTETALLQILTLGNADGRVIATVLTQGAPPVDINCRRVDKNTFGPCSATLPEGTVVKLQAIPTKGSSDQREPEFKGWFEGTGSASVCNGRTETTCQFPLTSFSTVKAKFCRAVLGCLGQ